MTKRTGARVAQGLALGAAAIALLPSTASATPSTTYWAPSVATCQAKYTPHITYDTYYGKGPGVAAYPIDTGLTMGILPGDKIQAEVGYDALLPSSDPTQVFVNFKLCTPESSMFKGSPAIGVGMYDVGFNKTTATQFGTDYNILYGIVQKSLPFGGYIAGGAYYGLGNDALFTNETGSKAKAGAIFGWSSPDIKIDIKGLEKIDIIADIQTGKNSFGGGGGGLEFYFNDYIDLIVGPVFFIDNNLQPAGHSHLWTTQLDVDIPLGKSKPAPAADTK